MVAQFERGGYRCLSGAPQHPKSLGLAGLKTWIHDLYLRTGFNSLPFHLC